MKIRKTLLAVAGLCLMATPLWAWGTFQAPLTGGTCVQTTGTVGTAAAQAIAAIAVGGTRGVLIIENNHATNSMAYSLDGTTPVIGGNGFTLGPLGKDIYSIWVPQGSVQVIGSGSGTAYTLCSG